MPTPFDWQQMDQSRLRLALGSAADPVEPASGPPGRLRLLARVPGEPDTAEPSRVVTLFPPVPKGPTPGTLLDRRATLIALAHPGLAVSLATGSFDDAAWVVDPLPQGADLASITADGHSLPVSQVISLIRDVARALAALHRRGLSHGAIRAEHVGLGPRGDDARLYGLGENVAGTPLSDLHALGEVAWLALAGTPYAGANGPSLVMMRPEVPDQLAELIDDLLKPAAGRRPMKAEMVLERLDPLAQPVSDEVALVDGSGRQARQPRLPIRWLVAALAVAALAILALTL